MTKAEAYDKAWRLGAKGDFLLVDQIYHPDYSSFETERELMPTQKMTK